MASLLTTRQPFKSLFLLISTAFTAVRIPFWIIFFLPATLRQHRQWTFRQAFVVRVLTAVLKTMSMAEHGKATPLKGKASKGWVVISPARSDAYTGVVLKDKKTTPETIGGTWYPKTLEKYAGEEIVLHVHGGAFVIGDGRAGDSGYTASTLLKHTRASYMFFPQYRLSCNDSPFPAALQDVITSYLYLTETLAIPANKITISGDSAGGNLCLSLLRYIADQPEAGLPSPRCAWLWSVWVDPGRALIKDPPFFAANAHTDYLNDEFGTWGARAYTPRPETGLTMTHPNIRFTEAPFATPTPLFFSQGECEALCHDIVKVGEEFKAVPGNKVELQVQDKAVHDIILLGNIVGFEKQAVEAAKAADLFLDGCE